MQINPMTPAEVEAANVIAIDSRVVSAINELLSLSYHNGYAEFTWQQVLRHVRNGHGEFAPYEDGVSTTTTLSRVQCVYQRYGWQVTLDLPDYTESYSPRLIFKKV